MTGDWDLAEECAQDAFALALQRWPRDGVPRRAGAWLSVTARNRPLDRLRRQAVGATKLKELAIDWPPNQGWQEDDSPLEDDRMRLIFTCCHPALPLDSRVALTLRTLAGLTTAEIAKAFLVPEPTMAMRLNRAKHKIRNAAIPYRVPPAYRLPERTGGVLAVLYLLFLFNEGYAASSGANLLREGLSSEAIRLARTLAGLMPDDPEALGLLALMLLHDARRSTRVDEAGDLVLLEAQDRSRWNKEEIDEGVRVLETALSHGRSGPYQLQAAIAACHATAVDAASTDWGEIAGLYGLLARGAPSPVVELNRAVTVGMSDGPAAALQLTEKIEASGDLAGYYLLPPTRADPLGRLNRPAEAAASYRETLDLAPTDAERRFLRRKLDEMRRHASRLPAARGSCAPIVQMSIATAGDGIS